MAVVTPTIFSIHLPLVRHNVSNQYVIISHINIWLFWEFRTVLTMKTQHDHYDRLSVRLSVIISRLMAGQSLELKALANEFGVSERTLQRDFQQRLIHLDLEHSSGCYRLIRRTGREHLPNTFAFILNSGISGIIPAQNRRLIRLITSSAGGSPCLIGHGGLPSPITQTTCFLELAEAIRDYPR